LHLYYLFSCFQLRGKEKTRKDRIFLVIVSHGNGFYEKPKTNKIRIKKRIKGEMFKPANLNGIADLLPPHTFPFATSFLRYGGNTPPINH
jgi:hypothetical protein